MLIDDSYIQYKMYTIHNTVYNVQCTLYTVSCILYLIQYTLYIVQDCTVLSIATFEHYTVCTVYIKSYIVHFIIHYTVQRLYSILVCTVYKLKPCYTVQRLYIVQCTLYTVYCTLYIVQCNVCTVYPFVQCTNIANVSLGFLLLPLPVHSLW